MKSLLIISSNGFEDNVMASIRLRRLVPSLTQNGWEVYCICPRSKEALSPKPKGFHLYTVPWTRSDNDISSKLKQKLLFPILGTWMGLRLIRSRSITHVLSSVPDIETLITGSLLKSLLKDRIQFTVEIRDPFSVNQAYPWSAFKRKVYRSLDHWLMRQPDKAIFLTSEIERLYLAEFTQKIPWKINHRVITNGFDPEQFVPQRQIQQKNRLYLTYTGNFYDGRHPLQFLETLAAFLDASKNVIEFEARFIGTVHGAALSAQIKALCSEEPLKSRVKWLGSFPHQQALQLIQESDVNFLITHESGSEYAIPGKIFEYMGAKKPILALTKDPLVIELVENGRLGWVCRTKEDLLHWFQKYLVDAAALRAFQWDSKAVQPYHIEEIHQRWEQFVGGTS